MILYATIQSERATKGQGGKYLQIDIYDAEKILVAHFDVSDTAEGIIITHDVDKDRVILEAERNPTTSADSYSCDKCNTYGPVNLKTGLCERCTPTKGNNQKDEKVCKHGKPNGWCCDF